MKHVIIKEARDSNLCKHQVKNVTHPFTSIEQYEATQCVPIGRLWNSEDCYLNMIHPRVTMAMKFLRMSNFFKLNCHGYTLSMYIQV